MRKYAILIVLTLCVTFLGGCNGIASIFDNGIEHLTGNEADEKLARSISSLNYEGMCEAVEAGADVNKLPTAVSLTGAKVPLYWLLTEGVQGQDIYGNWINTDFTEYLLKNGANPNYADKQGRTLLMLCCEADGTGYPSAYPLLKQLLEYGADVTL